MIFTHPHGAALYDEHHLGLLARYGGVCYPLRDQANAGRVITSLRGDYPGVYSATGVTLQSAGPPLAGELVKAAAFATNGSINVDGALPTSLRSSVTFTLNFWCKSDYASSKAALSLRTGTNGSKALVVYPYDTTGGNGLRILYNGANVTNVDSGAPADGGWHMFTHVQSAATTNRSYVDGVQVVSNLVNSFALDAALDNVTIGAWHPASQNITGSLAYATISPAAWTAVDVMQLYLVGRNGM